MPIDARISGMVQVPQPGPSFQTSLAEIGQRRNAQALQQQQLVNAQGVDQERQQRMGAASKAAGQQDQLDALQANAFTENEDGVFVFNRQLFEQSVIKGNMAHKLAELTPQLDALDKSTATALKARNQALAEAAYGVSLAGYTPAALTMAAAAVAKNKLASPDQVRQLVEAAQQNNSPDAIKAILTPFMLRDPDVAKRLEEGPKKAAELRSAQAEALSKEQGTLGTTPITPAQKATSAEAAVGHAETRRANLAREAQGRATLAQSAAEAAAKRATGAEPLGIESDVHVTPNQQSWVDLSKYKGKDYSAAQREAKAKGVKGVSAAEADALQNLTTAHSNIEEIRSHLDKLASNPATRFVTGPMNKVQAFFQTDEDLASWGTYRNQAIQAMRAAAGSKGLRINKAEIEMAIANDIPAITDTRAVAEAKMSRLDKLFTTNTAAILGPAETPAGGGKTAAYTVALPNGSTATFKSGAALEAFKKRAGL